MAFDSNPIKFLDDLHRSCQPDKWGWSEHKIGRYTLQTNGLAWNAFNSISGRRVDLAKVISEASHV